MAMRSVDQIIAGATAAYSAGQPERALRELEQVGARAKRDPRVHLLRGLALSAMARHDEAVRSIKRAVDIAPANAPRRVILARAMHDAGRFEDALDQTDRTLALDPRSFDAHLLSAATLTALGRHGDARARLDTISSAFPRERLSPQQRYSLAAAIANAAPHSTDPEDAIAALRRVLEESPDLPADARSTAWSHIGRLHEHLERYDEAFDAYERMNEAHSPRWDADAHAEHVDRMIDAWSGLEHETPEGVDGEGVVFIVGMMRSGTSLTEQMLAQLDSVMPLGETNHVPRAVMSHEAPALRRYRPMPSNPAKFGASVLRRMNTELRRAYQLDRLAGARVVTDKQPCNFLYLPLIARALPGAKVVHCVRDPVDTCLSCHTQNFADAHPYTARLDWLASYQQDHDRLMDAWAELGSPETVTLRYEDLVRDPRDALGPVLDAAGLSWDPSILDFHRSRRAVSTASIHQVRRPLYTRSVGRAQRFGARVEPLRSAFGRSGQR